MSGFLIIQTAFIGDAVLATSLVEKLKTHYPQTPIDFLVRKGNESLLQNNPHIREVLIWNKKKKKNINLLKLIFTIRRRKYDKVINVQRFFSTGLLTALSGAKDRIGFDKNPLSFLFTKKVAHIIDPKSGRHEIERNQDLIRSFTDNNPSLPKLYPSKSDFQLVEQYQTRPYITITPSSVWFTKKYPIAKWIDFIKSVPPDLQIFILGGPNNRDEALQLQKDSGSTYTKVLAGDLSFLQSSALMKSAAMNYVNDSAPLHFCSAMNAPVTAIFCSTIPGFGYTPLSDTSFIVETSELLSCRPCGLHGRKECPLGHFKCALTIHNEQLLATLPTDAIR